MGNGKLLPSAGLRVQGEGPQSQTGVKPLADLGKLGRKQRKDGALFFCLHAQPGLPDAQNLGTEASLLGTCQLGKARGGQPGLSLLEYCHLPRALSLSLL
jgi:hypothetical protein